MGGKKRGKQALRKKNSPRSIPASTLHLSLRIPGWVHTTAEDAPPDASPAYRPEPDPLAIQYNGAAVRGAIRGRGSGSASGDFSLMPVTDIFINRAIGSAITVSAAHRSKSQNGQNVPLSHGSRARTITERTSAILALELALLWHDGEPHPRGKAALMITNRKA
jgi:hypothetical protein